MEEIGRKYGTDKITHHGYHRFYPNFLDKLKVRSMLEIGVDRNCSMNMWLEYFPEAFVYGIDIGRNETGERLRIFQVDQSSESQLKYAMTQIKHPIDFIIDDGSHVPEHQLLTLNTYFNELLQPGGIYIIEDIETSYWRNTCVYNYPTNYGIGHSKSIVEICKKLTDTVNREFIVNELRTFLPEIKEDVQKWISTVTFGQNCIILKKKHTWEYEVYTERPYRFSYNVQNQVQDIRVFYHLCCVNNWKQVMEEQFMHIIFSGLYEVVSKIHIYVVSPTPDVVSVIEKYGSKFTIEKMVSEGKEEVCLDAIHDKVKDSTKFLYLHSKGVTRFGANTYMDGSGMSYAIPNMYSNIVDWRQLMQYFLIGKHKMCIEYLDKYDVVGVNFFDIKPHFSGNFWWSTGRHYNSIARDIPHGESFNTSQNASVVSLYQSEYLGGKHYFQSYPMENYIDKKVEPTHFIVKDGRIIHKKSLL